MRARSKQLLARLIAVFAVVALMLLAAAQSAQAVVPPLQWPAVSLSDVPNANHLISNLAGGVTVGCSTVMNRPVATKSFDASGAVTQSIPMTDQPQVWSCSGQSAVGSDGTLYSVAASGPSEVLVAYRGNTRLWTYTSPCVSHDNLTIGTNGYVYMTKTGGTCSSTHLIGIDPTLYPGETVPRTVADTVITRSIRSLATYNSGLVLRYFNGIEYFDYAGNSTGPATDLNLGGVSDSRFDATLNGRAFVNIYAPSSSTTMCGSRASQVIGTIDAYEPSGFKFSIPLPSCSEVFSIRPTYNGGVVAWIRHPVDTTTPGSPLVDELIANDRAGAALWALPLPSDDAAGRTYQAPAFAVDLNGNVAVQRPFVFTQVINGQTFRYPGIRFQLFSGNSGNEMSGGFVLDGNNSDGYGYRVTNPGEVVITKDKVYLSAARCYSTDYCDTANASLYAVTMPGLQMDYPRGAILNAGQPTLNYVGMGDSYATAEGVPPFDPATDVPNSNPALQDMCHRSYSAYPQLLNGDPVHRLSMSAFVACSGATTVNVINGQDSEGPQINFLFPSTDVVTITVGGDDIEFSKFASACVLSDCGTNSTIYASTITLAKNYLPGALDKAFTAIKAKVGPQTRVLVVGYPMMIPDPSLNTLPNCPYLSQDKKVAARDVVTQLDTALQNAVNAANNAQINRTFEYVDPMVAGNPFSGHELCTSGGYFNGLDVVNRNYSFHPNRAGQAAYWRLIENYLG